MNNLIDVIADAAKEVITHAAEIAKVTVATIENVKSAGTTDKTSQHEV